MTKHENEEPLDPAVEAIRVKMVRLLMVSGGIMMLGLMAVLLAIVYKINKSPVGQGVVPVVATSSEIKIPKGTQVISSAAAGDDLLITLQGAGGKVEIRRYNAAGQLISTYSIIEE